jgi:MFS family permease
MGYEVPATRPVRPPVVTAAVACLFILAGVQIISAIVALVTYGDIIDAVRRYADTVDSGDAVVLSTQFGQIVGIAFAALFAVGFAVLGLFVGRGKNPARITAWVVLGISLCCNAFGVIGSALGGLFSGAGSGSGNTIDAEELQRRVEAATPGWATGTTYTMLGISILAALAAVILLALPAANEFFRKVEPVWEPPVPGSVYPAPGQPGDAIPPAGGPYAQPDDPNRPGGGFAPPGP